MVVADEELHRAWAAGDESAGQRLFDRYFQPLYLFFFNKLSDGIEDLIQETFLACVEGREGFRGEASFRTFVFAVARNRLYKRWRRYERHGARIDFGLTSVADLGRTPSSVAASREEHNVLLVGLQRIPMDLQVALELYFWEEFTAAEIASVLDIPEGTARSRVRRGRELLLRELEQLGEAPLADAAIARDLRAWAVEIRAKLGGGGK
ncbi:MAG: RNA polymerase sigma factor [Planctomycetota bacterium]